MTRDEIDRLFLEAHAFDLHRAEEFRHTAPRSANPGTGNYWSQHGLGNMDFTTQETSLLIPYTMTTTHNSGNVYGDVTWAEPDIEAAAAAMRKLHDSPSELARIAAAGWQASRPRYQLDRFSKTLEHTCLGNGMVA